MREIELALARGARGSSSVGAEAAARRLAVAADEKGLVDIAFTTVDSPLGPLFIAATRKGIVRISYGYERLDEVLRELAEEISPRLLEVASRLEPLRRQLDEYFEGHRRGFDLAIDWGPTRGFSRRVLEATAQVPFGKVASYRQVAERAGNSRASRAAGNALGSNPIPIVVPCHRVVRTDGSIGGYTGGLEKKRFLLSHEGLEIE